ncbi:hypothetical protein [Flindersiella endophytica]
MTANDQRTAAVAAAVTALMRAGQFDLGANLLAADDSADPVILLARAELELERDFWLRTNSSEPAVAALEAAADRSGDPELRWEVGLLRLRQDYSRRLFDDTGAFVRPDRHSAELKASFAERAATIHATAPSTGPGRGWAAFWRGIVTENVVGDPSGADPHYSEALAVGEQQGNDILTSYALRHLGAHADPETARDYHLRSRRLRQAAGFVPGALAEQLMLAELEIEAGQGETGRVLAAEVHEWATALRLDGLAGFAKQVAASED